MKAFVRFCLVSVVLVALAFFCEGLRVNFFTEPDSKTTVQASTDSLTDPIQSEHSFIKFNTACLTSPTAEGQTVTRTVPALPAVRTGAHAGQNSTSRFWSSRYSATLTCKDIPCRHCGSCVFSGRFPFRAACTSPIKKRVSSPLQTANKVSS